jgi:glutathione synthase/RimK-type ligase-like ATP-grasp enzyme
MNNITEFDMLIVYSGRIASSASSMSVAITSPFPKKSKNKSYNIVYSYFLKMCQINNLKVGFTTSSDIIGAGRCKSYWLYKNNAWIKVQKAGFSKIIFDKFSPTNKDKLEKRKLLFSSKFIKPFNDPELFNICFDKQKTYEKLSTYSIPTILIEKKTKKGMTQALSLLKKTIAKHQNIQDFSSDIVMKDRFGAGGLNVYKFKKTQIQEMESLMKKHGKISFVIQPFIKFDKGFKFKDSSNPTDIRLIFLGKKIVQTYIRVAKKGDFRCNEHAGGLLKYINKNEVPSKIRRVSENIANIFNKINSLYALDFIVSNNNNVYLLEGNTGPGLDWHLSVKENEIEAKKLIRIIIKEIGKRINLSKNIYSKKIKVDITDKLKVDECHETQSIATII